MPATIALETPVGQLVTESPDRARVFEEYGIDYCCGGKLPLAEACRAKNADPEAVAARIAELDEAQPPAEPDWAGLSLTALCEHIIKVHHEHLRGELSRLHAMVDKVASVHGDNHAETIKIRSVFKRLKAELESHMGKEEVILFPWIRRIDAGQAAGPFPNDAVGSPIKCMEDEHAEAGEALARLNELTGGYDPPPHACNTWRVLYDGLERLEKDMHIHIHKENNVLFPRTLKAVTT